MAKLAPCLVTLRAEFDALNPDRDKSTDGWIGDAAHQENPTSDHNPDENGMVHAIDVDETGPWPDCTMEDIVQYLVKECRKSGESGRDRGRLKYIIYERRIWEASNGWAQRSYTGDNPHDKHVHVSCEYASGYENDTAPWGVADTFGGIPVDQGQFNTLMTNWANTADGRKCLARAVFTWDPGNNDTGATNDGIRNPDYAPDNKNATVGANYALERAIVAAKVGYDVRDRVDALTAKVDEILAALP